MRARIITRTSQDWQGFITQLTWQQLKNLLCAPLPRQKSSSLRTPGAPSGPAFLEDQPQAPLLGLIQPGCMHGNMQNNLLAGEFGQYGDAEILLK